MNAILEFQGEYRWLSNFWPAPVSHDGIRYASVEHAYQAAKTLDFAKRWEISQVDSPSEVKRIGKALPLRPDWEQAKFLIMRELLVQKFVRYPDLRKKLLATGDAELVENNLWGDKIWGVCRGVGENHLGRLLMAIRKELGD
jgi:hypothetical protein